MSFKSIRAALKSLAIGVFLAGTVTVPAATAENVSVRIINFRCDDGVYRPGVIVIRAGTVTNYSSCSAPAGISADTV